MSILEGELANTIGDALLDADLALDVMLHRQESGQWVDYPCKGFTDTFSALYVAAGAVQATDVKVVIIASTLPVEPAPNNFVTVCGERAGSCACHGRRGGRHAERPVRSFR